MKRLLHLWLVLFAAASACHSSQAPDRAAEGSPQGAVTAAASQHPPAASSVPPLIQALSTRHAHARIPDNFSEYASVPMSNGRRCVVGATTDDDGMNERPIAYATPANGKQPSWVDEFSSPSHVFQSRATHCASSGRALFVLLQSDTQSEQSLSQTLLRVVRVDPATGKVQAKRDVQIPGTYSTWVTAGPSHFRWNGNSLIVSGQDKSQASAESPTFTIRMDHDLAPVGENEP
ncbi:hypothetical protein [Rhodanobacter lindaniclasticus]